MLFLEKYLLYNYFRIHFSTIVYLTMRSHALFCIGVHVSEIKKQTGDSLRLSTNLHSLDISG